MKDHCGGGAHCICKSKTVRAIMSATNLDPTHGVETPMEPAPVLKPVQVSKLCQMTGTLPMEAAWEQLWKEGAIPWDAQGVTPVLTQLLKENKIRGGRALVPGCGLGYDVVALGSPARSVLGIDISKTVVQQASLFAEKSPNAKFVEFQTTDFFAFTPQFKFDLVFDYTFFCTVEPEMRQAWAEKMADVLALDGELITFMFPLDDHEGGPPYSVTVDSYEKVLNPLGFHMTSCDVNIPSLDARKGLEKLARWQRAISKA